TSHSRPYALQSIKANRCMGLARSCPIGRMASAQVLLVPTPFCRWDTIIWIARLEVLYPPTPVLDFHRWAYVYLNTDQSLESAARDIVINGDAHQTSVDMMHEDVAACDQMN